MDKVNERDRKHSVSLSQCIDISDIDYFIMSILRVEV
jgi:hypothetical protein